MPKRRKKGGAALPRLTLLAYSRAELQRFSDAAERCVSIAQEGRQLVNDLSAIAGALTALRDELDGLLATRRRKPKKGAGATELPLEPKEEAGAGPPADQQ